MLSTPGHTAIHVLLNLYTHQQAVKNKHTVQRNTNHLLSWLKRRHGGYSGCPNCCHVWTALLEQSNGSDKSVYTLSLTSKPTGVHTTILSPKPHAPGRIHSCSTSRGPIGLRMWKNVGLHFRWNSKDSRKASVCPWVQHSWLTHHLPPLGLQGSDPQECLPFCSPPHPPPRWQALLPLTFFQGSHCLRPWLVVPSDGEEEDLDKRAVQDSNH